MSDDEAVSSSSRLAQVLSNTVSTLRDDTFERDKETPPVNQRKIKRFLRKNSSFDMQSISTSMDKKNESKVLVLYTGGTIGMVRNAQGALAPAPNALEQKIRTTCTLHDEEYSSQRFGSLGDNLDQPFLLPLVLPHVHGHRRVIYSIYEYNPLLDSSNMQMEDWIQIAKDVEDA